MRLHVHYLNPSRPPEVRKCIEATIEHTLLDMFGSPENAKRAKDAFSRVRSPAMDWSRLFNQAVRTAGTRLTPTEVMAMKVTVRFDHE
jgi:hypothetical protein